MADDIEVHFYAQQGEVFLSCGDEAFVRVRDVVFAEAELAEIIDEAPDGIRLIWIERLAAPSDKPPPWLRDRMALLGCGLVGFAVLFVLAVGIATILGWIR